MRYINVAINLPVKNLFRQFTYALPPQFDYIGAGWRVIVPFARQTAEGFVVGEAGMLAAAGKLQRGAGRYRRRAVV